MSFRVEQGRVANLYSLRRNQEDTRQIIIFGAPSAQAKRIVLAVQDSSGNERVDSLNIRFGGLSDISAKKIIRPVVEQGDEIDEWRVIFPTRMQVTKQQVATLADDTAQAVPGNELPVLPLSNTTMSVTIGVNANLDSTASILTIRPISRRGENGKKQLLRLDSTAIVPLDLPGRTITGQAIKLAAPVREEATGAITVKPQTSASSYALDLLRTDNSVVSRKGFWFNSAANGKQRLQPVTWDHLPPGKYRIRILVDTNNNGKWDGPDRSFTRLPEPVIFGPNVLEVRPNWEQEEIVAF